MLRRGLLALGLVAGLTGASAHGQGLEWKFNKDDTFRYEMVSSTKQNLKLLKDKKPEGKEVKQDIESKIVMSYKVLDKTKDGSVVLEGKVESMKFRNAAGTVTADEKVQGATFKLTLSPQREVTAVEGYEAFVKHLAGDDANSLKTMQAVFPKEALAKSASEAFGFLPDKPAKTWTRDIQTPMGPLGSMTAKNVYTDEGSTSLDGKTVQKIGVESTVTYTPPDEKASAAPFRVVKGDLKVERAKGTIYFDPAAGRLVTLEQKITLKGPMSLLIQGTPIDAELDQEQTITTKLVK